jgi:hypothetical protein
MIRMTSRKLAGGVWSSDLVCRAGGDGAGVARALRGEGGGMKKSNPFATEVELRVAFRVTLPKGWVAVMRASDQPARTIVG